jgi:hypothetical protein
MSILDRLAGSETEASRPSGTVRRPTEANPALERYRAMVRTAPLETLERAHERAFESLTPEQRRELSHQLKVEAPADEGALFEKPGAVQPKALALLATRAEVRQPGTIEHAFSQLSSAGLLTGFLAGFLGSAPAQDFHASRGGTGDAAAHSGMTDGDSDFSEEFGQGVNDEGTAGGEGFKDDEFDPLV